MKRFLLPTIAMIAFCAIAPCDLNGQTNTLSYAGVPTVPINPGDSFTFTININFAPGNGELSLAGLSLWFYQMAGPGTAGGPFTLAFTSLTRAGSFLDIAQTSNNDLFGNPANPGGPSGPPRTMPLQPINNQGTGSPFQPSERTDLGAIASGGGNGAGTYFVASITLSTSMSTAPGTYTISNTTAATPGVGGPISVTNDDNATRTFAVDQSPFSFTVIPEPSTYALIAFGGIALAAAAYRRRVLS